MLVGVPREIKDNEYRVGIVPSTVRELADKGHQVVIETHAGAGAGFLDADYQSARAEIVPNGITLGRSKFVCPARARNLSQIHSEILKVCSGMLTRPLANNCHTRPV